MGVNAKENIVRVIEVDLTTTDYEPQGCFFIRSGAGGAIKYCPCSNDDDHFIIKTLDPSAIFNDPEYCRKIFKVGTTATSICAGFGV